MRSRWFLAGQGDGAVWKPSTAKVNPKGKGRMNKKRFETSKTPTITITHCQGDLLISDWMRSAVELEGEQFNGQMPELNNITIESQDDLKILVPTQAGLTIEAVDGRLTLKHIEGHITIKDGRGAISLKNLKSVKIHTAHQDLEVENINGSLTIGEALANVTVRNVGNLQLERGHQDVSVHYVNGFVNLEVINGSASLHTVSGDLSLGKIDGDANLSNLGGRNDLPSVGGEIRLNGGLVSGEHTFTAEGNIIVRWPVDAPLSLVASGIQVMSLLPLENKSETADNDYFDWPY